MAELRKAPGMRERSPGVWELIVEAGSDPVTGKRRQVSRACGGIMRDAKKARAELLAEVGQGRHSGSSGTVDELCQEWLKELERKGRSPSTIHNYRQTYRHNIEATLGSIPVMPGSGPRLASPKGRIATTARVSPARRWGGGQSGLWAGGRRLCDSGAVDRGSVPELGYLRADGCLVLGPDQECAADQSHGGPGLGVFVAEELDGDALISESLNGQLSFENG